MKKKKHKGPEGGAEFPVMYEEEEWNAVEKGISKYFGDYETVLHEIASPDIHVDICMIPPALQDGRDYYTLVTFGMGAYRMNVPEELAEQKLERAELFIKLPADWRMDDEALRDERWYWPFRLLKTIARLPVEENGWIGWGHTIAMEEGETYADNTKLCGCMIVGTDISGEDSWFCGLPDGDEVNFYQLLPLYEEEIEFKLAHGAKALLERFPADMPEAVDPVRPNAVLEG